MIHSRLITAFPRSSLARPRFLLWRYWHRFIKVGYNVDHHRPATLLNEILSNSLDFRDLGGGGYFRTPSSTALLKLFLETNLFVLRMFKQPKCFGGKALAKTGTETSRPAVRRGLFCLYWLRMKWEHRLSHPVAWARDDAWNHVPSFVMLYHT